ncbi:MAG TPA: hypothetical protein PKA74_19950, partial [Bauldia sp.]|nr:hypothetical protein [Bauldia sp.]
GLKQVSVADLIAFRQRSEKLVTRVGEQTVETRAGPARAFAFRTEWDPTEHLALVFGEIGDGRGVPVRLHRESVLDDVFKARSGLDAMVERLGRGGRGVIVFLREGSVGVAFSSERARDRVPGAEGHGTADERDRTWRQIGLNDVLVDHSLPYFTQWTTDPADHPSLTGSPVVGVAACQLADLPPQRARERAPCKAQLRGRLRREHRGLDGETGSSRPGLLDG